MQSRHTGEKLCTLQLNHAASGPLSAICGLPSAVRRPPKSVTQGILWKFDMIGRAAYNFHLAVVSTCLLRKE
jgi:hypothetical protein